MIQPTVVQDDKELSEASKTERDLTGFSSERATTLNHEEWFQEQGCRFCNRREQIRYLRKSLNSSNATGLVG